MPRYLREFQRVLPASGGIRRAGSAALDLCYLAEGLLDGFWEEDYLSPWDVAAGLVILRESGGVATRLDGTEIGAGGRVGPRRQFGRSLAAVGRPDGVKVR